MGNDKIDMWSNSARRILKNMGGVAYVKTISSDGVERYRIIKLDSRNVFRLYDSNECMFRGMGDKVADELISTGTYVSNFTGTKYKLIDEEEFRWNVII